MFGIPYRGRMLPVGMTSYSSKTIDQEQTSRNHEHSRAMMEIKEIVGKTPIVFDREFSYEEFLKSFNEEGLRYVIRLNTGNRVQIKNKKGKKISLNLTPGKYKIWSHVYYRGKVACHVIGYWGKGFKEPLYIITNYYPLKALQIYMGRMKIEQSFRDLKSMLGIDKNMSKIRKNMEKLQLIALLSYSIALWIGEHLRVIALSERNRKKYSGLFVLFRLSNSFSKDLIKSAIDQAYIFFIYLLTYSNYFVRSFVPT